VVLFTGLGRVRSGFNRYRRFFLGIGMTTDGMLSPVRDYLKSFKVDVFGVSNPAIWDLFGSSPIAKWATIAVFCVVMLVFVFKESLPSANPARGMRGD